MFLTVPGNSEDALPFRNMLCDPLGFFWQASLKMRLRKSSLMLFVLSR